MPFHLVSAEGVGIPIPMDDLALEAWTIQLERLEEDGASAGFYHRLGITFASTLHECLDPDLKPPTDAQIKYATAIARDLNINLPPEALRFRGSMAQFLDRFVETHKQKKTRFRSDNS